MLLQSFLFSGAVNAIFIIILLKNKAKSSYSNQLLIAWMGIIALQLFFYYDNLSAQPIFPNWLKLIGFSLPLISAPVLFFYISSLSFGSTIKFRSILFHTLPFIVFNFITFVVYYTNQGSLYLKDGFPHFGNHIDLKIIYFLSFLLAAVPGCYTVLSLLVLLRHRKRLADNYSYTEKINLDWLKWIVISLMILFFVLFLLIRYGTTYGLVSYRNLFAIVGAILACYVFFIGFCGLNQITLPDNAPLANDLKTAVSAAPSYKNSGLSDERAIALFLKLQLYMDDQKPFLKEDLSLSMLAAELRITPNQLSQVINQQSGISFFNFINSYRVRAVEDKLKEPAMSHYSLLSIAYDCGFRSKSSFNKIFKEITGQTPQQYKNLNN